jgi:hypothetical protein
VYILQSYNLIGHIQLAGSNIFNNIQAFVVKSGLIPININHYNGSFELINLKPDRYIIRLSKPGYLTMDYSVEVQSDTVERFKMVAGDLNSDGKIDILDIASICKKFSLSNGKEGWDPIMDFNGDQWIDIVDVSIVARNYNKKSNVSK